MRHLHITDSNSINLISYDPAKSLLNVTFPKTKSVWQYAGVPMDVFAALAGASSVGDVFNECIRNKYKAKRIWPK